MKRLIATRAAKSAHQGAQQSAQQSARHQSERGVALIIALFALLLLSAIAMGMMYMANTEMTVNNNYRDAQAAFYASQAGLQEARLRILNDASGGIPMGLAMPAATPTAMPTNGMITSAYYILNPLGAEVIQPWDQSANNVYRDDELCKEQYAITNGAANTGTAGLPCAVSPGTNYPAGAGWFTPVAASNLGGAGNNYFKWVRITRKQNNSSAPYPVDPAGAATQGICFDGRKEVLLPAGNASCELVPLPMGAVQGMTTVYTVTSLAVGPTRSRRMTQMEMAIMPPIYANAAVDSQDHVTLNGKLDITGYDNCSCVDLKLMTCNNSGKSPGSGTNLCTSPPVYGDRPGKVCDATKYAIFSSGSVDNPGPSEQLVAGPTPPVAENQAWPYDIPSMIQSYQSNAVPVTGAPYNWACTPGTVGPPAVNGSCGTHTSQSFGTAPAFPPTPPDNPPGVVSQVTYIPGDLKLTSSSTGAGVLIVDGDLDINGGLQFYGLILVRGVVKFSGGGSDTTNIFGAILAGQESMVDNVLGGSAVINFDACSLNKTKINNPPSVLVAREVMY